MNIERNGMSSRVDVVEACAWTHATELPFVSYPLAGHLSHVGTEPGSEAQTTRPAVDVFPYLDEADLVKIDVQGGEWELLADPRFASSRGLVVLEFHPRTGMAGGARAAALARLREIGFVTGPMVEEHAGEATLWAWKPD